MYLQKRQNGSAHLKEKLLYVCHRIPYPPNKGDKIRAFNFLKCLSRTFDIYLAFTIDDKIDFKHLDEINKYATEVVWVNINPKYRRIKGLVSLFMGKCLSVHYFYSKKLQRNIDRWLRENTFKAVLVYSSSMAEYVCSANHLTRIMDFCDVDSRKWSQYARGSFFPLSFLYKLEATRLQRYEHKIANDFDMSLFVSEKEADILKQFSPEAKTLVVQNGIDFAFYDGERTLFHKDDVHPTSPYIVFTGAMNYKPNIDAVCWFVSDVFPLVKRKLPDIRFYIVGNKPGKQVKKLSCPPKGVFVTGYVHDVRPYVRNAAVSVAPLRIARGVQTKVLESVALGCPTVATEEAAQGLGLLSELILTAPAAAEKFAAQVILAYERKSQIRDEIKVRMRTVERQLTWENQLSKLVSCLAQTAGRRRALHGAFTPK